MKTFFIRSTVAILVMTYVAVAYIEFGIAWNHNCKGMAENHYKQNCGLDAAVWHGVLWPAVRPGKEAIKFTS